MTARSADCMSRHERANRIARARTVAGLAAAVVPFAILVHLVAEGFALGRETFGAAFVVRHLYLGVAFAAAVALFARTVGIGCPPAERRRRCALITAQLRSTSAGFDVATLAAANLGFFGLSQLVEGVPIASGDCALGLLSAIAGSTVAALFVQLFGRSIAIAALVAIGVTQRRHRTPPRITTGRLRRSTRRAAVVFSLFVPNRPPPAAFLI